VCSRIALPVTVDEHQVGQLYTVANFSKEESDGSVAVEILKNEAYQDKVRKTTGQYTSKIYHIGERCPAIIKALAPAKALLLEEEAWNAYPYCKTVLTSPWMGESFSFIIETRHIDDDGAQENVHNLTPELLKKREVDFIDIAGEKVEDKKAYKKEEDPTLVRPEKAERGPLVDGWKEKKPLMCCYKLVTAEFKMFGLQGRVESFLMKFERDLFFNFHRQVYCWLDEWFGMTMGDIREYESRTKSELDNKLKQSEEKNGEKNGEKNKEKSGEKTGEKTAEKK